MNEQNRALTALVEAEQAAVFGYPLLGAHLSGPERDAARSAYDQHRSQRDLVATALTARGGQPPGAPAGYDVAVTDRGMALALAVHLEEALAQRWRDLVAVAQEPSLRQVGVQGLHDAAVAATRWRIVAGIRPAVPALPGS